MSHNRRRQESGVRSQESGVRRQTRYFFFSIYNLAPSSPSSPDQAACKAANLSFSSGVNSSGWPVICL
ncbi:hypothetical protein V0288_07260 [Pannus brasiliensis CCIBt3594]|uniref:Uncharacterized protein n=1 Tax=Pannus brasiliensis CCIBt3594 TaxID=1427578 RepID=A0AAW9QVD6_9CHRO